MVLHNAEEALFFPRYLPLVLARLPESWKPLAGAMTLGQMWTALLLVTLVPVALAAWATLRPGNGVPVWLLLLVQATLLLNALWHVSAAILIFNGYAPGLATAVLFNLPAAVYLLRRAAREDWVSRRARWALLPGAFLMHGPVLSGFLLMMERL
ncbi:MAG: motif-containing protein [Geminicoccaceae bacterium]|nr:motif-containing protein [Geminicoccaceae bacterium]